MWILALLTSIGSLVILAYAVYIQRKARLDQQNGARLSREIIHYFHKTGVEVLAVCTNLKGDERYTALIESEPMKRFRLSHIIELQLREHIQKTCALELECIYWRFPIKDANQHIFASKNEEDPATILPGELGEMAVTGNQPVAYTDDYINEGLVPYKDVPKIEVTETSWEKFEEVASLEAEHQSAQEVAPDNK